MQQAPVTQFGRVNNIDNNIHIVLGPRGLGLLDFPSSCSDTLYFDLAIYQRLLRPLIRYSVDIIRHSHIIACNMHIIYFTQIEWNIIVT